MSGRWKNFVDELNGRKMRVLLVEDDVVIRMATAEMLSDLGYDVVEAGSVKEASIALNTEPLQMLFADLGLPDGNAMELVEDVLKSRSDMPVIVASGADLREHIDNNAGHSITKLVKPYDLNSLEMALKQSIRDR